jgi:phage tail tube protein FII
MIKKLSREIAYSQLQKFFQEKPFVLFGTGMSCAVDMDFGMDALENKLKDQLSNNNCLSDKQKEEWQGVCNALKSGKDFETAMNSVQDNGLMKEIVKITGDFVSSVDRQYSAKILSGEINWLASALFKRLVDKTPVTDRKLHVATPNYDMLAEYAFAQADIKYINGFYGGIVRKFDWEQSGRAVTYADKTPVGKKIKIISREHRHIRLYKVHGSLNWFLINDELIENNSWLYTTPEDNVERFIITPGLSKYEKLHNFRNQLLGEYDKAVEKHNCFLFLGFGFRDNQLLNKTFVNKLKHQKSNGLIITKENNSEIDSLLEEAENLWLVCQGESENDTIIKNNKYSKPLLLKNEKLWEVDIFTKTILGGYIREN